MMKEESLILYLIAVIISFSLISTIINFVQMRAYPALLWICYIADFIIITGLFSRNSKIILSQVIILLIPDLLWIVSFLWLLISGQDLFGLSLYLPREQLSVWGKIASLQHLYVVPLSLVAIYVLKSQRDYKVLLSSFAEIAIIFLIAIFFAPAGMNIDCVIQNCINVPFNFLPYGVIWFVVTFILTALSYFAIEFIPFLKEKL